MLSRLISLLRRIPAVKWAFNRLRPLPLSGSIDVAPVVADEPQAPVADIAEASPTAAPLHEDAVVAATVPVAVEEPAELSTEVERELVEVADHIDGNNACDGEVADVEPVIAADVSAPLADGLSPAAESSDLITSEPYTEVLADAETVVVEIASEPLAEAESPAAEIPDIIASEPSAEVAADAEPVPTEAATTPLPKVESPAADISDLVVAGEPTSEALGGAEAVGVDDAPVALVEAASVAADVAPVTAEVPTPAMPVAADDVPSASLDSDANCAPVLVALPSPSKRSRAPKTPTRAADPADRATLIRQRWAETGIRMWNPRIHGTGDDTLSIQGRSELLPPAPGETMPRYDRLEFKMLGGQIVCEGVIVAAPAQTGQRSFTGLAEPVKSPRETVRERQAALA